jgi:hypothetical protein
MGFVSKNRLNGRSLVIEQKIRNGWTCLLMRIISSSNRQLKWHTKNYVLGSNFATGFTHTHTHTHTQLECHFIYFSHNQFSQDWIVSAASMTTTSFQSQTGYVVKTSQFPAKHLHTQDFGILRNTEGVSCPFDLSCFVVNISRWG